MCIGNSSASTDRSNTLAAYGDLNKSIGSLNKTGAQLTGAGAAATGQAQDYFSKILSGNPNQVAAAEGPQIAQNQSQNEQLLKQISNFGNRGGGTNSTTANLGAQTISNLVTGASTARSNAANQEASIGSTETGQGIGATTAGANTALGLGDLSSKNRAISQQIHDQAISNWANLVGDVLTGKGALTALQTWGS